MNEIEEFFNRLAIEWDSHEKTKTIEIKTLLEKLNIKKDSKLLDVACGTGIITGLLNKMSGSEVIGIDLSGNMIEIAKEKYKGFNDIHFIHGDFLTYDLKEKFDYAIIYNAYPHFLNPDLLAIKLNDVLNENGRFAIVHSLSKERLNSHHKNIALNVSRKLNSPEIEAKYFNKYFKIDIMEDTEKTYILSGVKYVN